MDNLKGIFSMRLVIADFYMEKPILALDPCYSEFRGKEIKKVPIIRVFGSNGSGQKTCMHIHGVFPYFYIPYDKGDFDSVNKAVYLIATNVDKAINISLGQGSSAAQHVFKIQLVKGIPFYGYHKTEHQLMKIYMFNPRFVRRAANLLQNGAIMGKNFHPFESHVPYTLQFMIDYNLYGMSLLHVPMDVVKFRRTNDEDEIPCDLVKAEQILDTAQAKKVSCCSLEVDVGSNFILNRFQLLSKKDNVNSNPGIESIWHDERVRRQKLAANLIDDLDKQKAIPPLEVPPTQERPNVEPTKTEIFYRSALLTKLSSMESSLSGSIMDQTIASTQQQPNDTINVTAMAPKEQKRTFNLSKLLANAVYPGECTQTDKLVNASFIENHLSKGGSDDPFYMTSSDVLQLGNSCNEMEPLVMEEDTVYMDDTVLDEELVLSLTQHVPMNASLREEDMQLLDILQQLEENGQAENQIDLDSSLAPLTQPHKNLEFTPELLDKETMAAASNQPLSDSDSESDNENGEGHLHDFSLAMDDIDDLLLKLTQTQAQTYKDAQAIPQVDGSDDLLRSPIKSTKTSSLFQQNTPPKTPTRSGPYATKQTRSPRTPKAAHRYAPLPLVVVKKSTMKNLESESAMVQPNESSRMSLNIDASRKGGSSSMSLRKSLAITELRRKSASALTANEFFSASTSAAAVASPTIAASATSSSTTSTLMAESPKTPRRSLRKTIDLDKTHITCALTPPRRKSERLLKVYNVDVKATEKRTSLRIRSKMKEQAAIGHETNNDLKVNSMNTECANEDAPTNSNNAVAKVNELESLKDPPPVLNSKSEVELSLEPPKTVHEDNNDLFSVEKQLLNLKHTLERSLCWNMPANQEASKEPTNNGIMDFMPQGEDEDEDEEISASGNEGDEVQHSLVKLRKTPNLKRLRRSFIATQSLKNKLRRLSMIHVTPEDVVTVVNSSKFLNESVTPSTPTIRSRVQTRSTSDNEDEDDENMMSFYENSFVLDSPSVFSDMSSPGYVRNQEHLTSEKESNISTPQHCDNTESTTKKTTPSPATPPGPSRSEQLKDCYIITPLDLPPTYDEVLAGCSKFDIPEYDFQQPFYSNPDDVTKDKELGFLVLRIPSNKLNDLPEFQSILGGVHKGLNEWRRKRVALSGGPLMLNRYRTTQKLREYCTGSQRIGIEPVTKAPTKHEAKIWLKAREIMQNSKQQQYRGNTDYDSPIKIRRQKVTMMLNDEGDGSGDSDGVGADLDYSTCSLSLTPLTPAISLGRSECQQNDCDTPLTTCQQQMDSRSCRRFARRSRMSLKDKLEAVKEGVANDNPEQNENFVKVSGAERSTQTSESSVVSSQSVLKEMERSSFMHGLHSGTKAKGDISFGLTNATLNNTFGFKVNLENLQEAKSDIECHNLTIITLELFVSTRSDLVPNPELDEIRCIFYAIENSVPVETTDKPSKLCGYIIVNEPSDFVKEGKIHGIDADIQVKVVTTEIQAVEELLALCSMWDADIYAGYEIEMASWGYVIERAKYLCLNIAPLLSRVPTQKTRDFIDEDRDQFTDLDIEMKLCGRILLDVWRLMRSEIALTSYTFENVMYHILHKRCPWHSFRKLSDWFESPSSRWIVIEYYLERVRGTLALLDQLDLIGRTSEMAKLIGIQFYEVLSRGSQFRVESMMLRIAKPRNLVPLSPSVQQRAHMRAPEYLALILEPQSRFYADPLIVLDFQSLYPSMIIAYNYCFSTCLGRVEHLGQSTPFEFGASQLRVPPALIRKLLDRDLVTISPCGVVFIKSSVREGILPRMLSEILDTRLMVKQSMKLHKSNSALQRILHSRQLGLKLMANVTYGYTAANFSGRMPAVEVGDSVVSKGRETLERAIQMVESNAKWNVRVVYGDTDSLFVLVPGRNREQAFKIGEEIAEAVTQDNPHPVKLKLEKVYQPCILQTKKRYVGYMYESADQAEPVYEAKGIETVRRDGCPAVAKMLEKVLRILFETTDVSQVKQYVCRQFTKLLSGRANLQDLIFAKEFRGLNGYKPTACVPALEMTRKWMLADPRRIPRRGERVPFIVINGPPGVPLIRLVRHAHEVISNEGYKINAIYYITKAIIPALNRCLLLIGADVNDWFAALPRKILMTPALSTANVMISHPQVLGSKKSTISQYFSTTNCIIDCGRQTKAGICAVCDCDPQRTVVTLHEKCAKLERAYTLTTQICQACCGRIGDISCASLDCPVLYVIEVKRRDLKQLPHLRQLLDERQWNLSAV